MCNNVSIYESFCKSDLSRFLCGCYLARVYLTLPQRLDFAKQQAEILGLPLLSEEDLGQIESLNLLTPGDFAVVARRHQFSPFQKVQDWLGALQGECEVKPAFSATTRQIGFC